MKTEDGNNVSSSVNAQYKYDMVVNNYTDDEYQKVCQTFRAIGKKYVIAKEIGESGTRHLQCYISLRKKERITALHKMEGLERASFRKCRNEQALIEYCMKDGDFIGHGVTVPPKPVKIITDLYPWQKEIEKVYLSEPDDRSIHWYWESNGNIGKSAFVKYMVVKHGCLFCDGGKKADLMNLVFNNDMNTCRGIIWDLPRSTKGNISYATLEAVKNGLICNTKYETGVKVFNSPHVIVFANFPPDDENQLSADRWKIIELTP